MSEHICSHEPAKTGSCYAMHNCRCDTCRELRRRYMVGVRLGGTARVDAQRLIPHLTRLKAAGMTDKSIANAAGLTQDAVTGVLRRRYGHITRRVAAALLSVEPQDPDVGLCPSFPTARRLQALGAIGYSSSDISAGCGLSPTMVRFLTKGSRPNVTVRTDRVVAAFYDAHSMIPLTGWKADRVRRESAAKGWAPPLAWDDDAGPNGLLNPQAKPSRGKATRLMSSAEAAAEVELLIGSASADQIVARLHRADVDSLATSLKRGGFSDLSTKLREMKEVS